MHLHLHLQDEQVDDTLTARTFPLDDALAELARFHGFRLDHVMDRLQAPDQLLVVLRLLANEEDFLHGVEGVAQHGVKLREHGHGLRDAEHGGVHLQTAIAIY